MVQVIPRPTARTCWNRERIVGEYPATFREALDAIMAGSPALRATVRRTRIRLASYSPANARSTSTGAFFGTSRVSVKIEYVPTASAMQGDRERALAAGFTVHRQTHRGWERCGAKWRVCYGKRCIGINQLCGAVREIAHKTGRLRFRWPASRSRRCGIPRRRNSCRSSAGR
jgi:hypothetical protein